MKTPVKRTTLVYLFFTIVLVFEYILNTIVYKKFYFSFCITQKKLFILCDVYLKKKKIVHQNFIWSTRQTAAISAKSPQWRLYQNDSGILWIFELSVSRVMTDLIIFSDGIPPFDQIRNHKKKNFFFKRDIYLLTFYTLTQNVYEY